MDFLIFHQENKSPIGAANLTGSESEIIPTVLLILHRDGLTTLELSPITTLSHLGAWSLLLRRMLHQVPRMKPQCTLGWSVRREIDMLARITFPIRRVHTCYPAAIIDAF